MRKNKNPQYWLFGVNSPFTFDVIILGDPACSDRDLRRDAITIAQKELGGRIAYVRTEPPRQLAELPVNAIEIKNVNWAWLIRR